MTTMSIIDSIYTCSEASGVMETKMEAKVIARVGLEGDRYAKGVGTYSVLKGSQVLGPDEPEPGRQVTLLSADEVDAALQRSNMADLLPNYGTLRRNIIVRGGLAPLHSTLDTIGKALRLGDSVVLFVHRHCVPCMYNEKKNGIPGLREAIWDEAGVNCEVLQGGMIRVGDQVQVLTNQELQALLGDEAKIPTVDIGYKPPGFFMKPKEQSAAMVKQALELRKQAYKRYTVTDPEGSARAQRSFASVGLSFWPASCTREKA